MCKRGSTFNCLLFCALVFVSLSLTCHGALVSWYTFEGTAENTVGNTMHGTLFGNASFVQDPEMGQVCSVEKLS